MSQYTLDPPQWDAILYDGTNGAAIQTAVGAVLTSFLVSQDLAGTTLYVLALDPETDGFNLITLGLGFYDSPWLLWTPTGRAPGEPRLLAARDDGAGAPLGFTAV